VIDVTTENFEQAVIEQSMTVPVVVDLWATWCGPCKTLSPILEMLAGAYGGRFVLAKIDVDAEQQIAAAFQVQSIPTIIAVVKGQPVPLFQGALPEAQVRAYLDQLLKAAEEMGVNGRVGAADEPESDEPVEEPLDPRFVAAFDAIEAGDWAQAEAEYAKLLNDSPADADAKAGVLLAQLMQRVESPADTGDAFTLELAAADLEAGGGDWAGAFARLVELVRASSGDERNAARQRLIDFFELAGDDPAVQPARIALASALF
jgi:putative thioredoxin